MKLMWQGEITASFNFFLALLRSIWALKKNSFKWFGYFSLSFSLSLSLSIYIYIYIRIYITRNVDYTEIQELNTIYIFYLGSIPGHIIPKTLKMVLDTSLLNIQQYKVCIKGKVEQSRERSSTLPYTSV